MITTEKIKQAYGKYWEVSKRYVDIENGTIANRDRNFDIHNGFWEIIKIKGENRFIPKSLKEL